MAEVTTITVEDEEDPQLVDRFFVADKDPNFAYRWVNQNERTMLQRRFDGWTNVPPKDESVPAEIAAMGQSIANPAGGTVQQRGDVILMRMPREHFERRIRKPKERARERQAASVDTMVQKANEDARKALRAQGYKDSSIRDNHVFTGTADSKFS
jgi:hypothetical protein